MGKAFKKFAKDKALKVKRGAGRPVFQSKKAKRQGFKLNQGVVLAKEGNHGKLTLPVPAPYKGEWHSIRFSEIPKNAEFGTISFYREHGHYYMAVPYKYETPLYIHKHTGKKTGIDVNVSHFNDAEEEHYFLHKGNNGAVSLARVYDNIKHQQRILARKLKENGQIRLPGSAQKAIKKRESSFRSFTSVLTACRMMQCTST
ncbi:hypothetical protein BTI70_00565, partial [Lactobacillus delbrueckii subsp. bulgaricus]|nr:hypothetical protein [Lactobacillus delbrueckii subsp. bulgaricus]